MKTIGVRDLRQQASKYLRLVGAGETVQITRRGRPVARLVPIPVGGRLSRLEADGRLTSADGDLLDLGPPLPPRKGVPLPAEALGRARAEER